MEKKQGALYLKNKFHLVLRRAQVCATFKLMMQSLHFWWIQILFEEVSTDLELYVLQGVEHYHADELHHLWSFWKVYSWCRHVSVFRSSLSFNVKTRLFKILEQRTPVIRKFFHNYFLCQRLRPKLFCFRWTWMLSLQIRLPNFRFAVIHQNSSPVTIGSCWLCIKFYNDESDAKSSVHP